MMGDAAAVAERFWAKVDRSGACWRWLGYCDPAGYGRAYLGMHPGTGKCVYGYAHRVAWELTHGPIPAAQHLVRMPTCPHPDCVRPDHHQLAPAAQPRAQAAAMRRPPRPATPTRPPGAWHPNAHLSAEQVRAIRRLHQEGVSGRQLAQRFAVSEATISRIVTRRTWPHVADERASAGGESAIRVLPAAARRASPPTDHVV